MPYWQWSCSIILLWNHHIFIQNAVTKSYLWLKYKFTVFDLIWSNRLQIWLNYKTILSFSPGQNTDSSKCSMKTWVCRIKPPRISLCQLHQKQFSSCPQLFGGKLQSTLKGRMQGKDLYWTPEHLTLWLLTTICQASFWSIFQQGQVLF